MFNKWWRCAGKSSRHLPSPSPLHASSDTHLLTHAHTHASPVLNTPRDLPLPLGKVTTPQPIALCTLSPHPPRPFPLCSLDVQASRPQALCMCPTAQLRGSHLPFQTSGYGSRTPHFPALSTEAPRRPRQTNRAESCPPWGLHSSTGSHGETGPLSKWCFGLCNTRLGSE